MTPNRWMSGTDLSVFRVSLRSCPRRKVRPLDPNRRHERLLPHDRLLVSLRLPSSATPAAPTSASRCRPRPGAPLGPIVHLDHRRLPRPAGGDRGGDAEARRAAEIDDRLRRGAGGRAPAQAHQRALGHGRARDRAPRRPRAGPPAQRLRGAGAVAAGDPGATGRGRSARSPSAGSGPQVILGPGHGSRHRARWSRPRAATRRSPPRPATSISARSRPRNSRSGRISSGRTAASPAKACSTAPGSRGSIGRA